MLFTLVQFGVKYSDSQEYCAKLLKVQRVMFNPNQFLQSCT